MLSSQNARKLYQSRTFQSTTAFEKWTSLDLQPPVLQSKVLETHPPCFKTILETRGPSQRSFIVALREAAKLQRMFR
ncbi:uncharacterized protein CCOS01_14775 [Colletotrichum costaricense]|uniref:Uncharacterized protein n=1 Tax=Colletotrichum costaricense TaxID=1209916 RepID=A0AAJ0DU55_9PEZI|nr:uncharacterized protein CCOS01_14775 [Colletotrichum costaricense]KAK1512535.1 hypothetical protein CCOS01_14775 [Colletotrichum costaricense]